MKPRLVIFDVDGLMLDTEARWQEAWQRTGEKYGIKDLGTNVFLKCVGRTGKVVEDTVKEELTHYDVNPLAILEECRNLGTKLLDERIDVKPGIYQLLDFLDDMTIQKAVATTTKRTLTNERLTRLGLINRFDYILCGDEVIQRKPNPEIYQKVIQHFNISPKEAIVLEDSFVGVEAAYRAQIPCVMIPDLLPPQSKQKEETIAILGSLEEAVEFLKKMERSNSHDIR